MNSNKAQQKFSLKSSAFALTSTRGAASMVSAIWFIIAARNLSLSEFGDFALGIALLGAAGVLVEFGFPGLLSQSVSSNPHLARRTVQHVRQSRLLISVFAGAAFFITYLLLSHSHSLLVPFAFLLSMFATASYTTDTAALRAIGLARVDGLMDVASRVFVVLVGSIWLIHGGGLLAAALIYGTADLLSALVLVWFTHRHLERSEITAHAQITIRQAAPLAAAGIIFAVYYRLDIIILAALRNSTNVATYAASYKIFDGILLSVWSFATLVVPATAKDPQHVRVPRTITLAFWCALVCCVPAIIITVEAPWILRILFGSDFVGSANTLRLLMIALPISGAVLVLNSVFGIVSRHLLLILEACVAILAVPITILLVAEWGKTGAAVSTIVGQTTLIFVLIVLFARRYGKPQLSEMESS